MTTQPGAAAPSRTIRLMHGAQCAGALAFALVVHFVMRPKNPESALPPTVLYAVLGFSVVASLVGLLVLRGRVPRRATDVSTDLFWSQAAAPAILAWSAPEAGALAAIIAYWFGGALFAAGAFALAMGGLIALRPGRLERL